MTPEELKVLISMDESYRVERTITLKNVDKLQEAICAFSNDLPGSGKKGNLMYVNMFNHGVRNVQNLLAKNESQPANFDVSLLTVFRVVVEDGNFSDARRIATNNLREVRESGLVPNLFQTCSDLSPLLKEMLMWWEKEDYALSEIRLASDTCSDSVPSQTNRLEGNFSIRNS